MYLYVCISLFGSMQQLVDCVLFPVPLLFLSLSLSLFTQIRQRQHRRVCVRERAVGFPHRADGGGAHQSVWRHWRAGQQSHTHSQAGRVCAVGTAAQAGEGHSGEGSGRGCKGAGRCAHSAACRCCLSSARPATMSEFFQHLHFFSSGMSCCCVGDQCSSL